MRVELLYVQKVLYVHIREKSKKLFHLAGTYVWNPKRYVLRCQKVSFKKVSKDLSLFLHRLNKCLLKIACWTYNSALWTYNIQGGHTIGHLWTYNSHDGHTIVFLWTYNI